VAHLAGNVKLYMSDAEGKVFVLGAGFSYAEQFPLINGLRARVIHFLEAERHSAYRVFLEPGNGGFPEGQFYEGLKRVDPTSTMEYEELLIALSKRCRAAGDREDPSFITDRVLRTGCARLLWCIQNSIWRASTGYENFAARLQQGRCPRVVSFNWDLLLEKALTDAGVQWSYGLDEGGVAILKPHGSINWSGHLRNAGLRAEYQGWRPLGSGSKLCFDSIDPLSNPNKQEINTDLRYMIYPGDPDLPTQDEDLRWIWGQIDRAISEAQQLVFIGYSLPDYDSFASDYFSQFANTKGVEAYTPSSEHLERYRKLFGDSSVRSSRTFEACPYAVAPPKP
jgi:hypothetical protein